MHQTIVQLQTKAVQDSESLRSTQTALERARSPSQASAELKRLRRARNKYRAAYKALGFAIHNSKQTLEQGTDSACLHEPEDDSDASRTDSDEER
jgi:hypothetical protein